MHFRNKNKPTDELSNLALQKRLEKLNWEHAESKGHAFEQIKISTVEAESIIFANHLRSIIKPVKLGDYIYHRVGIDRLERQSPKIKVKTKLFEKFKIGSPYKIRIKKKETGGFVTKIE